ncbi:hypothetical protein ABH924_000136 [Arthrobacter sp. GAS37]|uniref:hypothetical protein n=1 Tax=Arthrobacter sp. GAS37 TaxID=3156261 RepID=UPI00383663E6
MPFSNEDPGPTLVPTPVSPYLVRLWEIMPELEWITVAVEDGQIMPTPDEIKRLFSYAGRMKAVAEAAGFVFEGER